MYTAKEINEFQKKDRRISWLSIFSSLCNLFQKANGEVGLTPIEIEKIAYQINDELNIKYPMDEPEPFPSKGLWRDPATSKTCPVCGKPMNPQLEKRNPNSPDWKCSDKNCKFQFDKESKKWVPSQFITGLWNEK